VGSVNGYLPLPGNSSYAMSKFALRALCESLWDEWRGFGISVTHIAPGFVESEIRKVDNLGVLHPSAPDRVPKWIQMPADKAAKKMMGAVLARKRELILPLHGKLAVVIARHWPWVFRFLIPLFRVSARPKIPSPTTERLQQ
jgi:short-subunit dehydrogenase